MSEENAKPIGHQIGTGSDPMVYLRPDAVEISDERYDFYVTVSFQGMDDLVKWWNGNKPKRE